MQWLKHIAVDLIATIVIAIVVFYQELTVLQYVLFVYTGLIVLAQGFMVLNQNFRSLTKRKAENLPNWVYHILYGINVALLVYGGFYITAVGWIFIWGVAYYVHSLKD